MEFLHNLWIGIITAFRGIPMTLAVSIISVAIGLLIGFLLAFLRNSKYRVIRAISAVYVDVFRGTPMVVQAIIAAYGIPILLQSQGVDFNWPFMTIPATMVCALNSAAYMGEIVRGGLAAVDKGQREAAASLGITHSQAMRLVVVPQDHPPAAGQRIHHHDQGDRDPVLRGRRRDDAAGCASRVQNVRDVHSLYRRRDRVSDLHDPAFEVRALSGETDEDLRKRGKTA